MYYKIVQLFL